MQVVTGATLGAGAMYLLDPVDGRRRRHLVYDQVRSRVQDSRTLSRKALRDAANRVQGAWSAAAGRLRAEPVDDVVLVERVRARLGRVVSHPHAVHVEAEDGRVALSGPILARERERLLRSAGRVPGVYSVEDHLEPHEQAGGVPALQGGALRPGERSMPARWTPAARLVAAVTGLTLLGYCLKRRWAS